MTYSFIISSRISLFLKEIGWVTVNVISNVFVGELYQEFNCTWDFVRLPYMSISNKQPLHRGPISRTVTPFNANINRKNITACRINLLNVKVAYAIAIWSYEWIGLASFIRATLYIVFARGSITGSYTNREPWAHTVSHGDPRPGQHQQLDPRITFLLRVLTTVSTSTIFLVFIFKGVKPFFTHIKDWDGERGWGWVAPMYICVRLRMPNVYFKLGFVCAYTHLWI